MTSLKIQENKNNYIQTAGVILLMRACVQPGAHNPRNKRMNYTISIFCYVL